jgi:hypothetical protein
VLSRPYGLLGIPRTGGDQEVRVEPGWISAFVSFASAVTSVVAMLINRRNVHESVRPDLVLDEWQLINDEGDDEPKAVISIGSIRNLGRGPARNIWLELLVENKYSANTLFSYSKIIHLHPGEKRDLAGRGTFLWQDGLVSLDENTKKPILRLIHLVLRVCYWDNFGYMHDLRYKLRLCSTGLVFHGTERLAPGLGLVSRSVTVKKTWRWQGQIEGIDDDDRIALGVTFRRLLNRWEASKKRAEESTKRVEESKKRLRISQERYDQSKRMFATRSRQIETDFLQNNPTIKRLRIRAMLNEGEASNVRSLVHKVNQSEFQAMLPGTVLVWKVEERAEGLTDVILFHQPDMWRTFILREKTGLLTKLRTYVQVFTGWYPIRFDGDFTPLSPFTTEPFPTSDEPQAEADEAIGR